MAHLKTELSGSQNLAKASRKAIYQFFTSRRCPPRDWIGPAPAIEKTILNKFSRAVETLLYFISLIVVSLIVIEVVSVCEYLITKEFAGTDAAPDELKSMRITKQTTLKNLRVRIRDGAHAAGRCELMFDDVAVHVDPSSPERC